MVKHGVHTEHSPDYHFFACRRISLILDWQVQETKFARQLIFKKRKMFEALLVDVD